jgi:hypothetical protein
VTTSVQPYRHTEEMEGDIGLPQEWFRPPVLRFSGKFGRFNFLGEESETFNSFSAVVLRVLGSTRIKFEDSEESNRIECRSEDNIIPVDFAQADAIGAGPGCKQCVYAKFRQDGDRTLAPLCTEFVNILMATLDAEPMPFLFRVKSTSIRPMMKALNALQLRAARQRKPGYAFIVDLAAGDLVRQGKREWFPLSVSLSQDEVAPEHFEAFGNLWRWAKETTFQTTAPIGEMPDEALVEPDAAPAAATDEPPFEQQAQFDAMGEPVRPHGDPVDTGKRR